MRRAKSKPSMARWSDESISCGAQVESRTPSAVTTHEQLRLNACRSSRASVCVPCHSTLEDMYNTLFREPATRESLQPRPVGDDLLGPASTNATSVPVQRLART